MLQALGFLAVVEVIGLAAAPLAGLALGRLPGSGLGFAKPFGLLLVGWLAWMTASLGIAPYSPGLVAAAIAAVAVAGALAALRQRELARRLEDAPPPRGRFARWRRGRLAARALAPADPVRRPLFLGAEAVFVAGFAVTALLVSFAPDVWNTEKPMDMAFMAAIDATDSFPPADPWMAGEDLNYYYLGHLLSGLPWQLLGGDPSRAYNLALAVLFGLSAASVFTLGGTLWAAARLAGRGGPVGAGLTAVGLCLVLGNLAGAQAWLDAEDPPRDYDWFGPSRVVQDAITEFPWFSFTLGDLHAHVLAIPFTFLGLAFALQVLLSGPRGDVVWRAVAEALAAGLAVGMLWALNSWSYPVVAGLLVLAVAAWARDPASAGRRAYAAVWTALVLLAGVVLLLPFWLSFDPAAGGIALVRERSSFTELAGDTVLMYGVLLWAAVAAYASRVLAAERPARVAVWGGVGLVFAGSLLAPVDLAGVVVLLAALAAALHALLFARLAAPERFLWLLLAGGVTCVLIPELVYVRDAFDNGPLYRMNTVFKLSYQAWLLLAVAAACALPWAGLWLPRRAWAPWAVVAVVLVLLGLVYPYAGTYARHDGFSRPPTLDGLGWLRERAPGDVAAIHWLREHAPSGAVVLEAVGDDYSAFGHARISTFTGRPTVMGWEGHELQWEHDPAGRRGDVERLYRTASVAEARTLLSRYRVRYVVVGPIERADHGDSGLAKWDRLGHKAFDRDGTAVWDLTRPAP